MSEPRLFGISLGWVPFAAGPVWLVLTGVMAGAAWVVSRQEGPGVSAHTALIVGLIVLCWLHPLYSWLFDQVGLRRVAELTGSVVSLGVTLLVASQVRRTSPTAAAMLAPVAVWIAMATVYLAQLLPSEGGS
jgi:tryptophan-rich sensory protein